MEFNSTERMEEMKEPMTKSHPNEMEPEVLEHMDEKSIPLCGCISKT
jgi:hypothetical protein